MNKYQEALARIEKTAFFKTEHDFDNFRKDAKLLQELVDKATPVKLDRDRGFAECVCGVGFHGTVESEVSDGITISYCFSCGQALDWSEDESK